MPAVNIQIKELRDEARSGRSIRQQDLQRKLYGKNPCGEVTLSGRRRRLNPEQQFTLPKEPLAAATAAEIKDEIAAMKTFKAGINSLKPWGEVPAELIDMNDIRPKGEPIGTPEELTPLSRSGWDHLTDKGDAAFAYCRGDILVLYSSGAWRIWYPKVPALRQIAFGSVIQAQEFVEEILCS